MQFSIADYEKWFCVNCDYSLTIGSYGDITIPNIKLNIYHSYERSTPTTSTVVRIIY